MKNVTSAFLIKQHHCFAKCLQIFLRLGTEATASVSASVVVLEAVLITGQLSSIKRSFMVTEEGLTQSSFVNQPSDLIFLVHFPEACSNDV